MHSLNRAPKERFRCICIIFLDFDDAVDGWREISCGEIWALVFLLQDRMVIELQQANTSIGVMILSFAFPKRDSKSEYCSQRKTEWQTVSHTNSSP